MIHVLFNSPASKQPELVPTGFVEGLEMEPVVNSFTAPNPLG
jgi:hypothetical protein